MILALALLTVTHLSPESTSARLLPADSVGISSAPKPEVIPGLKKVWPVFAVTGALTLTTALTVFVILLAATPGPWTGIMIALVGGLIGGVINLVGGIVGFVISAENATVRWEYEQQRKRAPVSSVSAIEPTAVVFRF